MRAQCSKQLSVLKNIGIRVSIVHMILNMFFTPHGCFWAKHTIGKSLFVHFQIPGLVYTHSSIFGEKRFIYYLEKEDSLAIHMQSIIGGAVSQTFFHPEAGKPVSSIYTSPQASGKRRILTSFSVYPIYTTFSFNFLTSTPLLTRRSFIQIDSCKKTSVGSDV